MLRQDSATDGHWIALRFCLPGSALGEAISCIDKDTWTLLLDIGQSQREPTMEMDNAILAERDANRHRGRDKTSRLGGEWSSCSPCSPPWERLGREVRDSQRGLKLGVPSSRSQPAYFEVHQRPGQSQENPSNRTVEWGWTKWTWKKMLFLSVHLHCISLHSSLSLSRQTLSGTRCFPRSRP